MTIDEAIKHCLEVAEQKEHDSAELIDILDELDVDACKECAADHRQLAEWLAELQELRLQIEAPKLGSIEEYHYELAKCKAAFWSCNRRCMNAEEQYRRKADELRKAQEQIVEYKRLLKAAVEDMNSNNICYDINACNVCTEGKCVSCDTFHWRYTDEALKLIGGSENG